MRSTQILFQKKFVMKVDDMISACRVCLQDGDDNDMRSIYSRDEKDMAIVTKIEECGGIKITDCKSLPLNICNKCNKFLEIAYNFRTTCKNSDNFLQFFADTDCTTNILSITKGYEETNDDGIFFEETSDENVSNDTQIKFDNIECTTHHKFEDQELIDDNEVTKEFLDLENDMVISAFSPSEAKHIDPLYLPQSEELNVIKCKTDRPREQIQTVQPEFEYVEIDREKKDSRILTPKKPPNKNINNPRNKIANSQSKKVHICEVCGNKYEYRYCLENHVRRHRGVKPYECHICKKSFVVCFQLTRHMRCHTGQKPYKCKYCSKAFSDQSTRVKHERIHTNERPYKCDTCGKTFTYSNVLKVHMQIHKPYDAGLLHICEICGRTFKSKYRLEAHMRRHRGEKPYECEICKKSFVLSFQLTRHMRSHTGQKPYKCQYCDRAFADRSTCIKHERVHRNERPYKCSTCGKAFTYSNVLKVHKKIHL